MARTLLIVDDDPLYCQLLQAVAQQLGYDSLVCSDGSEAISLMKKSAIAIYAVLLDINMPMIDGISVLGHWQSVYPPIPCIIITGEDDHAHEKVAKQLGAIGYIKKPTQPHALVEELKQLLDTL